MPAFADIGKTAKDLLTGAFQYDHKVQVASKTASGVTLTANGKKKGEGVSGDVKVNYKVAKGVTLETTASSASKIDATVTMDDLAPGLKTSISASIPDKDSGKLSFTYGKGCWGTKGDIGLRGSPKLDLSAATTKDGFTAGGAIAYDTAKGAITKYDTGLQYSSADAVFAAILADKFDTLKVSYVHNVSKETSVGAEVARKMSKGTVAFTMGASHTLEGGAVAKASLNNTGAISALYQVDLKPKTTGIFSVCFDAKNLDKSAKMGMELKMKA